MVWALMRSIDIPGMTGLGVMVTNIDIPVAVRRPVATMALTLMLAASHRLLEKHNLTRQADGLKMQILWVQG